MVQSEAVRGQMRFWPFTVVMSLALVAAARLVDDVDVFVGTAGVGHTTPAAARPFGLIQAGPDTSAAEKTFAGNWEHCSGYQQGEGWLWRFSQTHVSGMGVPASGDLGLLPFVKEPADGIYSARMLKETEAAAPGWYSVKLADGITCEMAAGVHSAAYRFVYPAGSAAKLLVDLDWGLNPAGREGTFERRVFGSAFRLDAPDRVRGYIHGRSYVEHTLHFAAAFSSPVTSTRVVRESDGVRGETVVLDFGPLPNGVLEIRLALSTTSEAAAARNLASEIPVFAFDAVRAAASEAWEDWLTRAAPAPGGDFSVRRSFLAALYHLAFQPNDAGDVGDPRYVTFSLWDTFRAAHPLYTLLAPERVDGFVNSMLAEYRERGYLPHLSLWGRDTHCMIGHHSVPVIVDAFLKGFRGFDAPTLYGAVKDTLMFEHVPESTACWGLMKEDWSLLDHYGYYPFDKLRMRFRGQTACGESVSRTLECAYDAACAARFAEALGHREDAAFFRRRSEAWRNVFDASTGFMRGKDSQGRWRTPFDPYKLGSGPWQDNDFTEGNTWQYSWHVMQDPRGLVAALGGEKAAGEKLDRLFAAEEKTDGDSFTHDVSGLVGQYAHGNEPSHHVAYFYAFTDRPHRTAEIVRKVFDTQYRTGPLGLCGNEDCGQMSAWYVFSALGFYPFDPCGGDYVLGAPQLPGATLRLAGGRTLRIVAQNFAREHPHVKSVTLNGQLLTGCILRHADLLKGGELVFDMQP